MRLSGIRTALTRARGVKRKTGKSIAEQFLEMLRLRLGPGKIMPDEYFDFYLFDDQRFDPAAKRQFIGQWAKDDVYRVNNPGWRAIGEDKLISQLLFTALGAPSPKVVAVYHPARVYPARMLRTPSDLEAYLKAEAVYPLFAKPVDGGSAKSAYLLRGYEPESDTIKLGNGRGLSVAEFLSECTRWKAGMLFQELIVPHPSIRELCGPRVATMRLYIVNGVEGPFVHRAVLRLPTGNNMYDNFQGGASGNLLAALDEDGSILRIIGTNQHGLVEIQRHPDTNQSLIGFRVPNWEATIAACLHVSAAFPGLKVQAWDVAPSESGPLFVEMNTRGDLDLVQIAHRVGIADARWRTAFGKIA